jgi:hypothetical protein
MPKKLAGYWKAALFFAGLIVFAFEIHACEKNPAESEDKISGTWKFFAFSSVFSPLGGSYQTVETTLQLAQNGKAISGSHVQVKVVFCAIDSPPQVPQLPPPGGCFPHNYPEGPLSGSLNGARIVLEFNDDGDPELERFEGEVQGDKIQGDSSGSPLASSSTWSAERVKQ